MEFKKLSDVEIVETPAETANVLIEEDGVIKKAPKTSVGGSGEWDLDWELVGTYVEDGEGNGNMNLDYTINTINTFENIKNKILSGIQPKCKTKVTTTGWGKMDSSLKYTESLDFMYAVYYPAAGTDPESIYFKNWGAATSPYLSLDADNNIIGFGDDA